MLSRRSYFYIAAIILIPSVYFAYDYYGSGKCLQNSKRAVSLNILPELTEELQSFLTCERSIAALQIQKLGPAAESALPQVIKLVDDPDDSVRWRAAAAIGHIKKSTPEAIEAIKKLLTESHPTILHNALFAAREIKAESLATNILRHAPNSNIDVGWYALQVISSFDSLSEEGKKELIDKLDTISNRMSTAEVFRIIHKFKLIGAKDKLLDWIKTDQWEKRDLSLKALIFLLSDPQDKDSIDRVQAELIKLAFDSKDAATSIMIIDTALKIGALSNNSVDSVKEKVTSGDSNNIAKASRFIWKMDSRAAEFYEPLYKILSDDEVLKKLDDTTYEILPLAFANAASHTKNQVFEEQAIHLLEQLTLKEKGKLQFFPKASVAEALATFGTRAKGAIPILDKIKVYPLSRSSFIYAYSKIAPDNLQKNILLQDSLNDETFNARAHAYYALKLSSPKNAYSLHAECGDTADLYSLLKESLGKYEKAKLNDNLSEVEKAVSPGFYKKYLAQAEKDKRPEAVYAFPINYHPEPITPYLAQSSKACRAAFIYPFISEKYGTISMDMRPAINYKYIIFTKEEGRWVVAEYTGGDQITLYDPDMNPDNPSIKAATSEIISERLDMIDNEYDLLWENPIDSEIKLINLWPDTRVYLNDIEQSIRPSGYTLFEVGLPPSSTKNLTILSGIANGSYVKLRGLKKGENILRVTYNCREPTYSEKIRTIEFDIMIGRKTVYNFNKTAANGADLHDKFDITE